MENAICRRVWTLFRTGLFCGSLSLPAVRGAEVTIAVSGPTASIATGAPARFWLNALNPSTQPVSWSFPNEVPCRLVAQQNALEIRATLRDHRQARSVSIAPQTFARREYQLNLPGSWTGTVTVEFTDLPASRLVLEVQNPPAAASEEPPSGRVSAFLRGRGPSGKEGEYDPDDFFKEHIFGYEPLYFIAGTKSPNAKFQISFKYRLLNDHGLLAEKAPWLTGLHLAYSQTSLWDWNGPSAPFFDTSYKPGFLYAWQRVVGGAPTNWFRLDLQGGFQHESNGKAGPDSRSMNMAQLQPTFVFGKDTGPQLSLIPRAWVYLGDLSDNPDIAEYRGYVDLRAALGWKRGLQISALGRMGNHFNHSSAQIDVTYPLMHPPRGSFSIYLDAQYFTGYGESLLRYNQKSDAFRAGIAIYR